MRKSKGFDEVVVVNSRKVLVKGIDGKYIEIGGMKEYDILNRSGAITTLRKINGYTYVRYGGELMTLHRFLQLQLGLIDDKSKKAVHVKGSSYNGVADVEMWSNQEWVERKLLAGIDRSIKGNKTEIPFTYFNEVEQTWQVRVMKCNGRKRTKRTKNPEEIYNIIREIQLENIQEALEAGDMAYVADRIKRWNLK